MRQGVAPLFGVVFLFGTQAFASQTILLRMRPLALEEGVTEIYEAHDVVIRGRRTPHALQLQFKNVVREAARESGHGETTVGVLGVAAEMDDEAWKAVISRLEAKAASLDSESFRAKWVGFEARLGGDDAWGALQLRQTRLLGFRFWHEASIVQGGVMPVPSKDASDHGVRLLVGVFPDAPVAGAKRGEFLKSVSEHVDQARTEITVADLSEAAVHGLGILGLERSLVIVCREDAKGEWKASCHVDDAKADVLNPREACRALNQRLPLD